MTLVERPLRGMRRDERERYAVVVGVVSRLGPATTRSVYEATPWNHGGGPDASSWEAKSGRLARLTKRLKTAARYDLIDGHWSEASQGYIWSPRP